jgi:hypothetical protein
MVGSLVLFLSLFVCCFELIVGGTIPYLQVHPPLSTTHTATLFSFVSLDVDVTRSLFSGVGRAVDASEPDFFVLGEAPAVSDPMVDGWFRDAEN